MKETYCLTVKDYEGRAVVFTEQQLALKAPRRPELREEGILDRIKETVIRPGFVYTDFEHSGRLAYYLEEYRLNGRIRYMKVVLQPRSSDLFVVTAYRPDYVKERGKTKLIYGTDNE